MVTKQNTFLPNNLQIVLQIKLIFFINNMDVINKLYYTVSNTVTQISYALPGNAVTKEYEIFDQIASSGPGTFVFFIF